MPSFGYLSAILDRNPNANFQSLQSEHVAIERALILGIHKHANVAITGITVLVFVCLK